MRICWHYGLMYIEMMGNVVYEVNGLGYGLWGCRIDGCDVGLSNTIFVLCLYYKYNRKALHK